MVNTKDDGIFSLDEMMDLATKVEVFLTEQEARKCLKLLDLDGDDRVEEADFIAFMRQESRALINKAYRVREAACCLRRWLVRGTNNHANATSTAVASTQQWKAFKHQYEQLTKRKFPGYLDAQVLLITMSNLSIKLSALETRELTLLVAPEKNGRVHQADLHSFMAREHRTFGELIALVERELLKHLIDSYRAHLAALSATGQEDIDLSDLFRRKLNEIKKAVEKVYEQPPPGEDPEASRAAQEKKDDNEEEQYYTSRSPRVNLDVHANRQKRANMEVISVQQLKDGLEYYFK
jgi:Ca2+-binding EF-hand superfamily protein